MTNHRDPRHIEPNTLVEVTNVTLQNRHLLRPSQELNDIVIGVLGRAQRLYGMTVCGVVVLSTHLHILLVPKDAKHLAQFMCHIGTNLSKEVGRLYRWPGKLWAHRFKMVPISWEERAQVRRLEYLLSNGVKEFLVDRVVDWPGVHSADALMRGRDLPAHGTTVPRKARRASERGEPSIRMTLPAKKLWSCLRFPVGLICPHRRYAVESRRSWRESTKKERVSVSARAGARWA